MTQTVPPVLPAIRPSPSAHSLAEARTASSSPLTVPQAPVYDGPASPPQALLQFQRQQHRAVSIGGGTAAAAGHDASEDDYYTPQQQLQKKQIAAGGVAAGTAAAAVPQTPLAAKQEPAPSSPSALSGLAPPPSTPAPLAPTMTAAAAAAATAGLPAAPTMPAPVPSTSGNVSLELGKKENNLMYNERERRLLQDIQTLLITSEPQAIDYMFQQLAKEDVEAFIGATLNLTFARSTTLKLVRHFVEEEFKRHGSGEAEAANTLFRENSIASKILKAYLQRVGQSFLLDLLGAIETEVCIREQKVSYEIDPQFVPDEQEREHNQELLIAKIEKFLNVITSHSMVVKMPPGIRIIAAYFDEFANIYCHDMKADALIGGFLMLRYINPAIMTPDLAGLLPPGKQVTPKVRRNLLLVTKVLQNMSNGLLFTKKEPYLMALNPWLELNTPRLQRSFREIVKAASSCSTNLVIDSDVCSATVTDLQIVHQVIFAFSDGILGCMKSAKDQQALRQMMESLGTYARKISFANELDASEQAHVRATLTKYHEEPSYVCTMDIKKGKTASKFVFVVGKNRLFLMRKKPKVVPGASLVKEEAHILTLLEIRLWGQRGITLVFRNFEIEGETENPDEVVACIRRAFLASFSHFPREIMFKVTATPPAVVPPDEDMVGMVRREESACGGFVNTYQALCSYYGTPVSENLCWDIKRLYATNHVFDLKSLFPEEASDAEFVPALHALRYNTHFSTFVNDTFKIKSTATLNGISALLKCNTTLTTLSLPGSGLSDKVMLNLFEAVLSNPACHIVNFDLPDNDIDDKAATVLGSIIARRAPGNGIRTLILDSSLHNVKAFQALCRSASDVMSAQKAFLAANAAALNVSAPGTQSSSSVSSSSASSSASSSTQPSTDNTQLSPAAALAAAASFGSYKTSTTTPLSESVVNASGGSGGATGSGSGSGNGSGGGGGAIGPRFEMAQELEVLSLARNKIGDDAGELTKWMALAGGALRTLNVSGTGMSGARLNSFLISLTKGCKVLETLDVSDLKFSLAEVITVSQLFLIPTCRITSINMSGSLPSTAALLQFLALGKPGMSLKTVLHSHSFGSDPASLKQLYETMPKAQSITSLDLSDTDLGDDGVFYLAEGLTLNTNVRHLYINGAVFRTDSKRPRAETVRALCKLVISDCPLETLEMAGGPKATQQLGLAIVPLMQALIHNTRLTSLDISGHMFGTAGAKALARVLQLNASLTRVVYDQNDVGLSGLIAIANSVKLNSTLEVFPLPVVDIAAILASDRSAEAVHFVRLVCQDLELALNSSDI